MFFSPYIYYLLLTCGDIEVNPGPKRVKLGLSNICRWNLNDIDFVKVSFIFIYLSLHKNNIMFLSETFLNFSTEDDATTQNRRLPPGKS